MGPQLALIGNPPPDWWVQRQKRRNPIRFTGPAFTFMPFNPFQKFAVDLLGVGYEGGGKKKNPAARTYHVLDKRSGQRVSTEHARSKKAAIEQAEAWTGVHRSYLKADVVTYSDVDRSQVGMFGEIPEVEIEREQRQEGSGGQAEMFNPQARRGTRRERMKFGSPDPEATGLNFEERIQLYAQRVAQGLDPLTGMPPAGALPVEWLEGEQKRSRHVFTPWELPDVELDVAPPPPPVVHLLPPPPPAPVRKTGECLCGAPLHGRRKLCPGCQWEREDRAGKKRAQEEARLIHEAEAASTKRRRSRRKPAGKRIEVSLGPFDPKKAIHSEPWKYELAYLKGVYSNRALSKALGVSHTSLMYWMSGRHSPCIEYQVRISELAAQSPGSTGPSHRPRVSRVITTELLKVLDELKIKYRTWSAIEIAAGLHRGELTKIRKGTRRVSQETERRIRDLLPRQNPHHLYMRNPGSDMQRFEALGKANEITSERMLPVTQGLLDALRALASRRRSQSALARELGVSKQHLSNLLTGRRRRVDRGLVRKIHWLLNPRGAPGDGGYAGQSGGYAANPARVIPELARLMNPSRKRRRNRDAKWKKEPDTWEVDLDEVEDVGYFKEAMKKFTRFHETKANKAMIIRIPDGKSKTTRLDKVYVALGHRKQTPYTVDDWDSSKADTYWYHDHPEGKEPLMILDPQLGVVSDVGGSYLVDDWFYS